MDDKKLAMYELGRYYEEGIKPSEEAMRVAIRTLQNAIELEELGKQPVKSNTIAFNVNGHCYGVMGGDEIIGEFEKDFPETKQTEPCEDAVLRKAVLYAIDAVVWRFCDYLIRNNRNDEQKTVCLFADNLRECIREELPSVNSQKEITEEDVKKYCMQRNLVCMTYELFYQKTHKPHKVGRWLPVIVSSGRDSWKCSLCGRRARGKIENLPYCHCGAKMEGY